MIFKNGEELEISLYFGNNRSRSFFGSLHDVGNWRQFEGFLGKYGWKFIS